MSTTLDGLLNIGSNSLESNQLGIAIAGNNISNASTTGYNERNLVVNEGAGPAPGSGASASVSRAQDFVLSESIASQAGNLADATATQSSLSDIESAIQAGQNNLSQDVTNLGTAFSQLAASPGDDTLRTAVINQGQAVAAEFNRVGQQMTSLQASNQQQAQALLPQINALSQQLAALNKQTVQSTPGTTTADAQSSAQIDLDQRDSDAKQLATLTGGQVLQNTDGTVDVLVGGLSLVHGSVAQDISLTSQAGALQVAVGGVAPSQPVGGQLGGFLTASTTAQQILGQFDKLAFDLTGTINTQHAVGVGLDGVGNRPFFAPLATAAGASVSMQVSPDLTPTTLAAGFTSASGDNRNALAIANLVDQPVFEGGIATFSSAYSGIVTNLGSQVQDAQSAVTTATNQNQALSNSLSSEVGVSTDEETTKLLAYQAGYEAASKFISVVNEIMYTLVSMTND